MSGASCFVMTSSFTTTSLMPLRDGMSSYPEHLGRLFEKIPIQQALQQGDYTNPQLTDPNQLILFDL